MTNEQIEPTRVELLTGVIADLASIKVQMITLSQKCSDRGERRIGWEIQQSVRALNEAVYLAGVYLNQSHKVK